MQVMPEIAFVFSVDSLSGVFLLKEFKSEFLNY